MMMGMPDDMIGAIKIKDGLFIGDEFAAQVSLVTLEGKEVVFMLKWMMGGVQASLLMLCLLQDLDFI